MRAAIELGDEGCNKAPMAPATSTGPDALPVESILPDLAAALSESRNVILIAAPGAGKTTRVPLAMREAPFLAGRRIVMLEPRRVAARAAARHMARLMGEEAGETVGYRVRFDARVSDRTRIEVVTEGMLTRRLQSDPSLEGTGLLIFDEFHERSLDADLGLALALDVQSALRPDLRILVMSATLDAARLKTVLGDAPVIRSEGRAFPVETRHGERTRREDVGPAVASAVLAALGRHDGGILAFLPGEAEIRRAEERLRSAGLGPETLILPFHGSLGAAEQDRAIAPAGPGTRKVVLSTTLAESSLTIDGVSVVIDGGFKRVPQFDPASGMTRLKTVRVSLAAADQRRGRAGRLGPGVCHRLWPEVENRALAAHDEPEIAKADLAPFLLDVAAWGERDAASLKLLDPPPAGSLAQASDLLAALGAIDDKGAITAHGRAMAALPLHPRFAHMVIRGGAAGAGGIAADIAALLAERDVVDAPHDASIATRLEAMAGRARDVRGVHQGGLARARSAAQQIRRAAGARAGGGREDAGFLVALAYPDRIAKARDQQGRFRLASGAGVVIDPADALSREEFLAVATTDGKAADARIRLAAPLSRATLIERFADHFQRQDVLGWDRRAGAVVAREEQRLGALIIHERAQSDPDPERVAEAMIEGIRVLTIDALPWTAGVETLRDRVRFMRRVDPRGSWPDLSRDELLATLDEWLKPHLYGMSRAEHLSRLDLHSILSGLLTPAQRQRIETLLPTHFTTRNGTRIAIDYGGEDTAALEVKLQEMLGTADVPAIADGRLKLRIVLLSPAGRPLAVTQDLRSFWANAYPEVRAEMRGRYPKHFWPDDPLTAPPTRGRKPR